MKGWPRTKNRQARAKAAGKKSPAREGIRTYVPEEGRLPKPVNRVRIFPSSDGYSLVLELSCHTPSEHEAECDAVCVGLLVMPWQQMEFIGQSMIDRVGEYREALATSAREHDQIEEIVEPEAPPEPHLVEPPGEEMTQEQVDEYRDELARAAKERIDR